MKSPFWKKSLVARLVFSFLLLSLVTTFLLGFMAFMQARSALQASVLDRLHVAASLKEDALNQWVSDQTQSLLMLAELPAVHLQASALLRHETSTLEYRAAYAALKQTLSVAARKPEWLDILLLAPNSEIVFSTSRSVEGEYRILERYFTQGQRVPSSKKCILRRRRSNP
ncbi:MAG: hypothetical protein ACE5G0_15200 [Rhodothermales bacterium]